MNIQQVDKLGVKMGVMYLCILINLGLANLFISKEWSRFAWGWGRGEWNVPNLEKDNHRTE